jgi:hypothetical protein
MGPLVDVEAVGHGSSCSWWIETETGAPLTGLSGGLLVAAAGTVEPASQFESVALASLCMD